jgi:hypothetical protein
MFIYSTLVLVQKGAGEPVEGKIAGFVPDEGTFDNLFGRYPEPGSQISHIVLAQCR